MKTYYKPFNHYLLTMQQYNFPFGRLLLIFCLLLSGSAAFSQDCDCDHVISLEDTEWYFDGAKHNVQPGDKICFESGTRIGIELRNIVGTAAKPVIVQNMCDGQVIIEDAPTRGNAIVVRNSKYLRITGGNNPNVDYGIELSGAHMGLSLINLTTDVEADHIHIHDVAGIGVEAKTDPTCDESTWRGNFEMNNVYLHHNLVEDIGAEGFYIGNSHYASGVTKTCDGSAITIYEHNMHNVEVAYNIVRNTQLDGIQLSAVLTGMEVHHNEVYNYGVEGKYAQRSGIQTGAGCHGMIYNNIVDTGTGEGFFDAGRGNTQFYNNVVKNAMVGFLHQKAAPYYAGPSVYANNLIIDCEKSGFHLYSTNETHILVNNILINADEDFTWFQRNSKSVPTIELNNLTATSVSILKFVNASANDFSLQSGSPARDGGLNVISTYGLGIDYDLNDNPRLDTWDIGPCEYQGSTTNVAPTVNAGSDKTAVAGQSTPVVLAATATDTDGTIASAVWAKRSGPTVALTGIKTLTLTCNDLKAGEYIFRITVTDDEGATAYDEVTIDVTETSDGGGTDGGGDTEEVVVATARFNFTDAAQNVSGWNDLVGNPNEEVIVAKDAATGMMVNSISTSQWNPYNSSCAYAGGMTNGTIEDAAVVKTNWFTMSAPYASKVNGIYQTDNVRVFKLDPDKKYNIRMGASRAPGGPTNHYGTMEYRVNGDDPQTLEVTSNTTREVVYASVSPSSSGMIGISARSIEGETLAFGYIGWLVVEELGTSTSSATKDDEASTNTTPAKFNFALNAATISGWNTLAGYPHEKVISATDATTSITVSSVSTNQWKPLADYETSAYDGGALSASVQPDAVVQTNWFNYLAPYGAYYNGVLQADNIQISGLTANTDYELQVGASRRTGGYANQYGVMEYRFNGGQISKLNVTNNADNQVVVTATSDANGRIGISARMIDGSAMEIGYIGWLVVTPASAATASAARVAAVNTDDLETYGDGGEETATKARVTTYPNPTRDVLQIDLTGFEGEAELQVMSLAGQPVAHKTVAAGIVQQLEVSSWKPGLYVLNILINQQHRVAKKIIVQR